MQSARLDFNEGFRVVLGNSRGQAAVMVIAPGESEGGLDNRHSGADQWLLVMNGSGLAIVDGHDAPLEPGTLLLIEAGETHEIRSTGSVLLETVNFYLPPAYDKSGEETPEGSA